MLSYTTPFFTPDRLLGIRFHSMHEHAQTPNRRLLHRAEIGVTGLAAIGEAPAEEDNATIPFAERYLVAAMGKSLSESRKMQKRVKAGDRLRVSIFPTGGSKLGFSGTCHGFSLSRVFSVLLYAYAPINPPSRSIRLDYEDRDRWFNVSGTPLNLHLNEHACGRNRSPGFPTWVAGLIFKDRVPCANGDQLRAIGAIAWNGPKLSARSPKEPAARLATFRVAEISV